MAQADPQEKKTTSFGDQRRQRVTVWSQENVLELVTVTRPREYAKTPGMYTSNSKLRPNF